jgi:hypothetical protein
MATTFYIYSPKKEHMNKYNLLQIFNIISNTEIRTFEDDLNRRVRSRKPAPQTLQELQQAFEQEWRRIPKDRIRRLIESMPRRFVLCCRIMVGTTDIDFEVTSSERYGL